MGTGAGGLLMALLDGILARGLLPDVAIRFGIRRLLAGRLRDEGRYDDLRRRRREEALAARFRAGPIAVATEAANAQHYALPPAFFERVLGPRLKYSSAYWPAGVSDLGAAEDAMLELCFDRAELTDGQRILDLGCGWGSSCLALAARLPSSEVVAVSNSGEQRRFIEARATERGLGNLVVLTADINDFAAPGSFDRIVSIEMLEHVRNHPALFERLHDWLKPGGKMFAHVFCHRFLTYAFEAEGEDDWMARTFFTGGLMPSADLLPQACGPLDTEARWLVNGRHYAKTARAWLDAMDGQRADIEAILAEVYGAASRRRWWSYWRIFFLACEELFAFRGGEEWMVAHYRFARSNDSARTM